MNFSCMGWTAYGTSRKLYAMKNLRQKLTPGLTLRGLIMGMLIVSVHASDFPELGVVPRNGGFRMEGYWVWCGSVIKGDDGRYHLFASRWPKDITFHPGWMTSSEIVRAVADRPEGPYVRSEERRGGEERES